MSATQKGPPLAMRASYPDHLCTGMCESDTTRASSTVYRTCVLLNFNCRVLTRRVSYYSTLWTSLALNKRGCAYLLPRAQDTCVFRRTPLQLPAPLGTTPNRHQRAKSGGPQDLYRLQEKYALYFTVTNVSVDTKTHSKAAGDEAKKRGGTFPSVLVSGRYPCRHSYAFKRKRNADTQDNMCGR